MISYHLHLIMLPILRCPTKQFVMYAKYCKVVDIVIFYISQSYLIPQTYANFNS